KKKYELLINIDMAARLEWRAYSRYSGVPEGSVAGLDASSGNDQIFIGRHLSDGLYLPGVVDIPQGSYEFGILRVWDVKGGVHEFNSGDVLVEIEPRATNWSWS
ncbi:Unzipped, partial [Caligus rogercresseyi]